MLNTIINRSNSKKNGEHYTQLAVPFVYNDRSEVVFAQIGASQFVHAYDALSRPTTRNSDTFGYNERGEVVFSRRDAENAEDVYAHDGIGNLQIASFNFVTNTYSASNLNQYTSILRDSPLAAASRWPSASIAYSSQMSTRRAATSSLTSVTFHSSPRPRSAA